MSSLEFTFPLCLRKAICLRSLFNPLVSPSTLAHFHAAIGAGFLVANLKSEAKRARALENFVRNFGHYVVEAVVESYLSELEQGNLSLPCLTALSASHSNETALRVAIEKAREDLIKVCAFDAEQWRNGDWFWADSGKLAQRIIDEVTERLGHQSNVGAFRRYHDSVAIQHDDEQAE